LVVLKTWELVSIIQNKNMKLEKKSKRYQELNKNFDPNNLYTLSESINWLKQNLKVKFNPSVSIILNLNLTKKGAILLRGNLNLPYFNGQEKVILALSKTQIEQAKKAKANYVGGVELIEKIQKEKWLDFDLIVATKEMMPFLAKIARIIGPKGLMPSIKNETISNDLFETISKIKNSKVFYRQDKFGILNLVIGKLDFENEKLIENAKFVISQIQKLKPSTHKGSFIKDIFIYATMGKSLKINKNNLK